MEWLSRSRWLWVDISCGAWYVITPVFGMSQCMLFWVDQSMTRHPRHATDSGVIEYWVPREILNHNHLKWLNQSIRALQMSSFSTLLISCALKGLFILKLVWIWRVIDVMVVYTSMSWWKSLIFMLMFLWKSGILQCNFFPPKFGGHEIRIWRLKFLETHERHQPVIISTMLIYMLIIEGGSHFDSLISFDDYSTWYSAWYSELALWNADCSTIVLISDITTELAGDITAVFTGFSDGFTDVWFKW
jgi:hypothetical protein